MNRRLSYQSINYLILLSLCGLLAVNNTAFAHTSNQSFLKLAYQADSQKTQLTALSQQSALTGEWLIPLSFLDRVLDLDANQDESITWAEGLLARARIEGYLKQVLHFSQPVENETGHDGVCDIQFSRFMLQNMREGLALFLPFSVICPEPLTSATLPMLDYELFFNEDPWHRGYIRFESDDQLQNLIASPNESRFQLGAAVSIFAQIKQFIIEGVWHIWIGLDHILFLLALLLPAVFCYQPVRAKKLVQFSTPDIGTERSSQAFLPMFYDTLKIVTAFTLSHSLTLGLAAFQIVNLPAALVEIAIAISVVISALLLWMPALQPYRWPIAFGFGFIHGFGFANVLADLTLPPETFAWCLLAFNIGVELGQLAIVAVVLPLMFSLRNIRFYTRVAIPSAMSGIALVGVFWIVERSIGL